MAICSSCGGSGIQRISEQRFRTCQDCLGRGVLKPVASPSKSTFTGRSVAHSLEHTSEQSQEVVFKTAATSVSAK
jgi:DnaJ-class molecular chaperone